MRVLVTWRIKSRLPSSAHPSVNCPAYLPSCLTAPNPKSPPRVSSALLQPLNILSQRTCLDPHVPLPTLCSHAKPVPRAAVIIAQMVVLHLLPFHPWSQPCWLREWSLMLSLPLEAQTHCILVPKEDYCLYSCIWLFIVEDTTTWMVTWHSLELGHDEQMSYEHCKCEPPKPSSFLRALRDRQLGPRANNCL